MYYLKFTCPDCNEQVLLQIAVIEAGQIKFIGHCGDCQKVFRYLLDTITEQLLSTAQTDRTVN